MTKRKVFGIVLFALFATGLTACATAGAETADQNQTAAESTATKAALGVRKPKHVAVATMTARQMLAGEAEMSADEVTIVTCGPAIRQLADGSKRADIVRKGMEDGVQYKACGVTVERMGFDDSKFLDGVEVVPNGFVELLRLQEQGFHTIEL
jgi:intracellular sulfur oxidation DsrE/DsrF family protein